jgi:hypothetical protein
MFTSLLVSSLGCDQNDSTECTETIHLVEDYFRVDTVKTCSIKIEINPIHNSYTFAEPIDFTVEVLNIDTVCCRLVYYYPDYSTFGPWTMMANLVQEPEIRDVLEYPNKSILSSQLYFNETIQDHAQVLQPGSSITDTISLSDISIYKVGEYLPKGEYLLNVYYYGISSNYINFEVIN